MAVLRNGCLFVHVPKNAGSSIRQAMMDAGCFGLCPVHNAGKDIRHKENRYQPHSTPQELQLALGNCSSLWKFAVARDPWDRILSLRRYQHKQMSLAKYVDRLINESKFDQSRYFLDPQWYDCVLRYENLVEDWSSIKDKLGIDSDLPRVNVSLQDDEPLLQWDATTWNNVREWESPFLKAFPEYDRPCQ